MDYVSWLIIAAGLIILEMFFGSFYILPVGLAAAIVAVFSWMEYDLSVQLSVAGIATLVFWFSLHRWAVKSKTTVVDPSFSDVGNQVEWLNVTQTGTWRIRYRGTEWDARPARPEVDPDRPLYIVGQEANSFVVDNEIVRGG